MALLQASAKLTSTMLTSLYQAKTEKTGKEPLAMQGTTAGCLKGISDSRADGRL